MGIQTYLLLQLRSKLSWDVILGYLMLIAGVNNSLGIYFSGQLNLGDLAVIKTKEVGIV